ncbi:MAG: TRAP transporter small permease [Opitutales bacterium]|nr:TRAP transporter small permease [Opitutales bacterium]
MIRFQKYLNETLNWLLISVMVFLVVDVIWGVFTRYITGEQAKWTEELARYLLIWVSLLGAAVGFRNKSHLGIDLFVNALTPDVRRWVTLFAYVVVLFFASVIFIFGGTLLVGNTFSMQQTTPALGIPMAFVYLSVPVSGCFIVFYTLQSLWEAWKQGGEN